MKQFDKVFNLIFVASLFLIVSFWLWGAINYKPKPKMPQCPYPDDVIIGNGEYDSDSLYWSEYHCVSEQGFVREPKPISGKSSILVP